MIEDLKKSLEQKMKCVDKTKSLIAKMKKLTKSSYLVEKNKYKGIISDGLTDETAEDMHLSIMEWESTLIDLQNLICKMRRIGLNRIQEVEKNILKDELDPISIKKLASLNSYIVESTMEWDKLLDSEMNLLT
jgi:hypothetical protein